jgi:hypothetical protein
LNTFGAKFRFARLNEKAPAKAGVFTPAAFDRAYTPTDYFGAGVSPAAPVWRPVLGVALVGPAPFVTVSWPPAFGLDSREAGPPFWLSLIVPSGLLVDVVCASVDAVIATRIEATSRLFIF